MHGVAERVEDGRHVEVDASQMAPDVRGRQRDVFRECPREVDPDPLCPGALHTPARDAVAAPPADQVALAAHEVTHLEVVDIDAELHDLPDELVTDDQRHRDVRLRPGVPRIDVEVRPANAGSQDLDQDFAPANCGYRHVRVAQARFGLRFDESLHRDHSSLLSGILQRDDLSSGPLRERLGRRAGESLWRVREEWKRLAPWRKSTPWNRPRWVRPSIWTWPRNA